MPSKARLMIVLILTSLVSAMAAESTVVEIPMEELADRIQGGLLAQIIGNLNGLPHELKYNDAPGNVGSYVPALPEGGRTDDDTDIEWVHIYAMQKDERVLLPPERIVELWQKHITGYIWCANRYTQRLMDIGIEPPMTGRIAMNPWSLFNISGQFCCEAYGLISPAMPQAGSRIGIHYTHITVDGEPIQATQLFDTMIAVAFIEHDVAKIVEAGLASVDPTSDIHQVVRDVIGWHKAYPKDWRKTWDEIHKKWARFGGMRDFNGHELNTAAIIGSLLYGKGNFVETIRLGFNFGYDADCNAATAATVIGVIRGRKWIDEQGWLIVDRYRNITRPGMPNDETITSYGDRLVAVARRVIKDNGGEIITRDGREIARIRTQSPANVEPLPKPLDRIDTLKAELLPTIKRDLIGDKQAKARAAYLAICLDEAGRLAKERPAEWKTALEALHDYPGLIKLVYSVPKPAGDKLQQRAKTAGLKKPEPKKK